MPFCPSVLSVLGSPVPVFVFFCHQIIMWHLFVPLVNQRFQVGIQNIRVAELSAIFSGWNHEPRTTNYEKKGFLSFFIFFYSKCGNHFFLEGLTPWDSRE